MIATLFAFRAMAWAGPEMTVQVYNRAEAPASELRKALEEAGWILRHAGISAHFVVCGDAWTVAGTDPGPDRGCAQAQPGVFLLSMLREDPRTGANVAALGFAVLAGRRNGAAVLYPRAVSKLRDNPQYGDCNILASVVAHELGHTCCWARTNTAQRSLKRIGMRQPCER